MKYPLGTIVRVINGGTGALGANHMVGTVIDASIQNSRGRERGDVAVRMTDGGVWLFSSKDAEFEVLDAIPRVIELEQALLKISVELEKARSIIADAQNALRKVVNG